MAIRFAVPVVCGALAFMYTSKLAAQTVPTTTTAPSTASAPSTRPVSDVQKANEVRNLIEQAVKSKNAEEATKLMEDASQLLKQISDPDAMKLAVYTFDSKEISLNHLLKPKTSVKTEKVIVLTDKLKLVERGHRKGYPFVGLADNGKGFIIPVPHENDELEEQDLQLDGKSIFRVNKTQPWKQFYASPDSRMVVLADWLQTKPMQVLDVVRGTSVSVAEPKELNDHYYVYAFKFFKWADDSKKFMVTVDGTTMSQGQMMAYRETWQVDPTTGIAARFSRAEQIWSEKLKWDEPTSASSPSK